MFMKGWKIWGCPCLDSDPDQGEADLLTGHPQFPDGQVTDRTPQLDGGYL